MHESNICSFYKKTFANCEFTIQYFLTKNMNPEEKKNFKNSYGHFFNLMEIIYFYKILFFVWMPKMLQEKKLTFEKRLCEDLNLKYIHTPQKTYTQYTLY